MKFDLKTVVLEGVDCSGKTTAFRELHKLSGFKWNIHDRSTLSMLCYAIMYGRDVSHWRSLFNEEVNDLNNVIVVLMPPIEVIRTRLSQRGDEFQDQTSIVKLYEIFAEEVVKIVNYPNVLVCYQDTPNYGTISKWLLNYESQTYSRLADVMRESALAAPTSEINFMKVSWSDTDFKTLSNKSLFYEPEVEYYDETISKLIKKIQDEISGRNEYEAKQSVTSRRFVMTQDTCISYAHFLYRDGFLHTNIVCRSSEMSRIFPNDIHFLAHMGRTARREIGLSDDVPVKFYLTLDSAHVIFQQSH